MKIDHSFYEPYNYEVSDTTAVDADNNPTETTYYADAAATAPVFKIHREWEQNSAGQFYVKKEWRTLLK